MNPEGAGQPLLRLTGFGVSFRSAHGSVAAVHGVDLAVQPGECLGVAGESGAGKSQLFLGAFGLSAPTARLHGSARLGTQELTQLNARALAALRGRQVGFVFQDPMSALTPHLSIGAQLTETYRTHLGGSAAAARAAALRLLTQVEVPEAARRLGQFPHELSGGLRQRAMIALALAAGPQLLIADEPT
ncbi:MAG TPA: ATP-binding cassette domain-containing protein, partial [Steroidobacteraceae bacterium]|nr:ATP-binding cassette domain-containing protein [Steroidobacteraceae bacterium]